MCDTLCVYINKWQKSIQCTVHYVQCVQKNPKCFLWYLLKNMGNSDEIWYTIPWINLLQNYANIFHFTWIMSLHYLVKLEMLIGHVIQLSFHRNSSIYRTSTVDSKFARIRHVGTTAKEGVHNIHQWPWQTETATENEMGQAGSWCYCGNHSSVASLIAPDQWCVFCTPSLAEFPTFMCDELDWNMANLEATVEVL